MNVKKCVRALLCLYLTLIIAMDAVKAQALKVGDTLPPQLWSMPLQVINHPEGKETISLTEYKDKLIILDFWATWCGTCIKSLTKLDTLQKEFTGQLAVIPTTYENADKVLPFLTKRGYQLPSVINDSLLKKYFPHRSVPHQVWIQDNKVLAITGAEHATRENIKSALSGNISLKTKNDLTIDYFKPVSRYAMEQGSEIRTFSVLTGNINGTGGVGKRTNDSLQSHYQLNVSLLSLYRNTLKIPFNRILLETASPLIREETYCYQLVAPLHVKSETITRKIIEDLNAGFGLNGRFEKRTAKCVVLKDLENTDLNPKDTLGLLLAIKQLTANLNHTMAWSEDSKIYVTENDGTGQFSFKDQNHISDLKRDYVAFKAYMSSIGIAVSEEERELDFYIISDH